MHPQQTLCSSQSSQRAGWLSPIALCKGDGYWWGSGLVMGHGSGAVVGSKPWRPGGHQACWYFVLSDWALGGSSLCPHGPVRPPSWLEATRDRLELRAASLGEAEVEVEDRVSPPCASSSHPTSPQPLAPC